jgi:response regulator of citrate/malate metabolism
MYYLKQHEIGRHDRCFSDRKQSEICGHTSKSLLLAGFSVDTAVGFNEGMTKLCDHQYQVILINPFFRDGPADDLLEMLRNDNRLGRVLVCSADPERVRRSIEQGIMAVSKPVTFLHLVQLINHMLRTAAVQA